jgi:SPP1 family predicted phage head-tail adaptor
MVRAGDLDRRITLQRLSESGSNAFNEPVEVWTDLATIWARRADISDSERMAAGQVGAALTSRFVVRSSSITRTMTPADRIFYAGSVWNIFGIKETRAGRNQYLEITAAREAD